MDYVDIHITFYDAPNDLKSLTDLDIYVTVSNSKRLSKDNISEFHGKSDEIRVHPLSFSEFNKRGASCLSYIRPSAAAKTKRSTFLSSLAFAIAPNSA